MAIRHIALFRWNGEATPEKVDQVRDALSQLPGRIPALRAYTFGPDLGISEGTYDFGVAADVDDEAGLAAYRDHPDHQAALALIRPLLADRASVQIALPDPG
ncbi:Dabb family protein [Nocardiopsis halophila]|uniref:Dabb family protein n=1 Tax=Nocardiopsis halophila TaxID=141692 RepID=UPI00034D2EF4|nr:Dabb family protein [Nocardiopsis halophila]